LRVMLF